MKNIIHDVPVWTWYTGQFLIQFDKQLKENSEMTISEFSAKFLDDCIKEGLPVFSTHNTGLPFLLMYGLLVIPKEYWEEDHTEFEFKTRSLFINIDKKLETTDFLRFMRNAISHAHFSMEDTPDQIVTFWNKTGKGERNFEVSISCNYLGVFLEELSIYYLTIVRPRLESIASVRLR